MTRSGSMRSYWSMVTNIHKKVSGTNDSEKETRRIIKKLTGVKLNTFPDNKKVRKAIKIFKERRKKRAKAYQKEVNETRKMLGRKDKITLKDALDLMPEYTIDGASSEDFPTGESP